VNAALKEADRFEKTKKKLELSATTAQRLEVEFQAKASLAE
jgi:hypothetical protein